MRINTSDIEKVTAAIIEAEGKASARTILHSDIIETISDIEKRLSGLLCKKDWKGLRFQCDPNAQSFPASYKYSPDSTSFRLERGATGWFVTNISRIICASPSNRIAPLNIKDKSGEIAAFISQSKNW